MKVFTKLAVVFLMMGLVSGFSSFSAYAETDPIEVDFYDLHMDATGLMEWKMDLPEEYEDLKVQKYTISVDIMTTGVWRENYRTFTSLENSKEINFGLVGIYRFCVKAHFIGGFVSEYSDYSNNCTVTEDYVNKGAGGSTIGGPGTTGTGSVPSSLPSWVETSGQWVNENGNWFYANNGSIYRNKWACIYNPYAKTGAGQRAYDWFCFDESGCMRTGWYTDGTGNTYYLNPNSDGSRGKMFTGWHTIDGITYYFYEQEGTGYMGAMARNTTISGHILDANGKMVR